MYGMGVFQINYTVRLNQTVHHIHIETAWDKKLIGTIFPNRQGLLKVRLELRTLRRIQMLPQNFDYILVSSSDLQNY